MDQVEADSRQIFDAAMQLPEGSRRGFLEAACRSSPELRLRIEALASAALDATFGPDEMPAKPAGIRSSGLSAGSRLGRYEVVEQLGSGSMGAVYLARDSSLERLVAIKMIAPGVLADAEARLLFRREALALARLNHAHIAAAYDAGEQDGRDYIVMEYVPGESLAHRLRRGPMTAAEATAVALGIAQALEEAHEQHIVHRDLKPANVVLTAKGGAKVLDFGLAKLVAGGDATQSLAETQHVVGTPLYMSPEQAMGKPVDVRTDLWSLGVIYYEALTGRPPFNGPGIPALLHSITTGTPAPMRSFRAGLPAQAERIANKSLQKDLRNRYSTAAAMAADLSALSAMLSGAVAAEPSVPRSSLRWVAAAFLLVLAGLAAFGVTYYRRAREQRWVREDAAAQIDQLQSAHRWLAAFQLIQRAQHDLPGNSNWSQVAADNSIATSITSDPSGATVAVQDYLDTSVAWKVLGTTPLDNISMPSGFFRWKVSRPGHPDFIAGRAAAESVKFRLTQVDQAPPGMVYSPGGGWGGYVAFLGWLGPYKFQPYYIDQFEVTNRDYQKFVDAGGYADRSYWREDFTDADKPVPWQEAVSRFHDTTGRPGPSGWVGGHYPDGKADFPVSGVSWYEASAYAAYSGKSLPVFGQWFQAAEVDFAPILSQAGNTGSGGLVRAGASRQAGRYGTYDLEGNVREWVANPVSGGMRFILGGSWRSQPYLSQNPEALPPWDRSDVNGFRCVRNQGPLPAASTQPFVRQVRDFANFKPSSDEVFRAYSLLYAYSKAVPLDARIEGIVQDTADWQEQKISYAAAYNGERVTAYLFLPKRVKPPFQTMLFFPSARIYFGSGNSSDLVDINFFDYVVQSGRAVLYPVYEDTYERKLKYDLPDASQHPELTRRWYQDAARSLDYLATRSDIDSSRLGYVGVSMGAAEGVIMASLLQDRLRTVVFLDGGFFMGKAPPGADQADFVSRLKKPVLMVNGRYDFTFPVNEAQDTMFAMLGTDAADKKHVILETPHDVTEQRTQLVSTVLQWLDKYMGPVQPAGN